MLGSRSTAEGTFTERAIPARSASGRASADTTPVSTKGGLEDERAIVDRARGGDVAAQGAIFDCYWPKIVRYTYAHCGNQQDAEDLASEVFLRMIEAIGRFQWRDNVPFTAWLFRIARNQVVSHYRRRTPTLPLTDDGIGDPVGPDDPQEAVESHLALGEVYQAAEKLPKLQQEVIRLRFA